MNLPKAGGLSSIALAMLLLGGLAANYALLDTSSISEPLRRTAYLVEHKGAFEAFAFFLYVLFGVLLVVVSLGWHRVLSGRKPDLSIVATAFGLMWSILLVGSGLAHIAGLEAVATLHRADPQGASILLAAVEFIHEGLGCMKEIPGGLWLALVGFSWRTSDRTPRPLGCLAMITGAAGMASAIPVLATPGVAVFAFGSIVWLAWSGILLTTSKITAS